MSTIFVAGLANVETTLRVDGFPLDYAPITYNFFGIDSTVSAVGYNVAKALARLGDEVRFASLIGADPLGGLVLGELAAAGIPAGGVLRQLGRTAQSVVLFDPGGRRRIASDLKDIQDQAYPLGRARAAMAGCDLAVLCNINFARPLLGLARELGVPVATDLHALGSLDDGYNRDWLEAATIIFQSHEGCAEPPAERAAAILARFPARIVVIGMGGAGSLLAERGRPISHIPAAQVRPVVNTVGAGDAFFASFAHFYAASGDPRAAIERASLFAGYKVGANGGAKGLLSADAFAALWDRWTAGS
ncbi:MAG TPA: carbohydrate kinase family protein [Herpetosiphonaceae bacterium]|nr:carbohydrate kinase family protein [Herpetosiphonaceae bacterium]